MGQKNVQQSQKVGKLSKTMVAPDKSVFFYYIFHKLDAHV